MTARVTSWTQSTEHPSVDINVEVTDSPAEGSKFSVVVDGHDLTLSQGESELAAWKLFDKVASEVSWETKEKGLVINLTKLSPEPWKSALRTPLPDTFAGLMTDEQLDELLAKELKPLPSKSSTGPLSEEDADALLDDALSSHTLEEKELIILETELQEINKRVAEIEKEVEAATEAGGEALEVGEKKLGIVRKMAEYCQKVTDLRREPVTIQNLLEVLKYEIYKTKLNRGEKEEETEEFKGEEEQAMSPDTMYVSGIRCLEARDGPNGLHFLRLAAIRHGHPQALMTLVRLYMEAGEQPKSLSLLLKKALSEDMEPLANFTTAQMFDNGVSHFRPHAALALYFYQRSARTGECSAMAFAGQLFLRGGCIMSERSDSLVDKARGMLWLTEAVNRGSALAYKMMLELHFEGKHVIPSFDEAKRLYTALSECSREHLRQIPNIDSQMEELRRKCGGGGLGTAPKPKNDDDDDDVIDLPRRQPAQPSSASQRFAQLERKLAGDSPSSGAGGLGTISTMSAAPARSARDVAQSEARRKMWERRTTTVVALGAVYALAFPLRILSLPYVFTLLDGLLNFMPFLRRADGGAGGMPMGGAMF
eukprot:PhM_4_TR12326/c0_g1_i1/m.18177